MELRGPRGRGLAEARSSLGPLFSLDPLFSPDPLFLLDLLGIRADCGSPAFAVDVKPTEIAFRERFESVSKAPDPTSPPPDPLISKDLDALGEKIEAAESRLEISVLGPTRVEKLASGGTPERVDCTRKELAFLAHLVISDKPLARESLAELFWPERPPEQSAANLRVLLSRLRRKLGHRLHITRELVELDRDRVNTDLWRLRRALDAVADGTASANAVAAAERAIDGWQGELATGARVEGGAAYDDWLDEAHRAFCRRLHEVRSLLLEMHLEGGDLRAALQHSSALLADDPYDEQACRRHMNILVRSGRRADALSFFDTHRRILGTELGLEPGEATIDLARAIRAGAPAGDRAPGPSTSRLESRARSVLLDRVERFWIDNVLATATPPGGGFRLPEARRPELLAPTWPELPLSSPEGPSTPELGEGAEAALGEGSVPRRWVGTRSGLLILGEPGAGKTFRLLELAREGIRAARSDPTAPVPVVLHLAAWPLSGSATLVGWVIEQLRARYHIPANIGERWATDGSLMLLLDGLDELAPPARPSCINALNESRHQAGLMPIAVCCRSRTAQEIADEIAPLELDEAIELLPLTQGQLADFLKRTGRDGQWVNLLERDSSWQELLTNPLMLSLASEAVAGVDEPGASKHWQTTLRTSLVDRFVRHVLTREGRSGPSSARLRSYLRGLASGMLREHQSIFQIDSLQPSWLPSARWRTAYLIASRLMMSGVWMAMVITFVFLAKARIEWLDWRAIGVSLPVATLALVFVDMARMRWPETARSLGMVRKWFLCSGVAFVILSVSWVAGARTLDGAAVFGLGFAGVFVWRPQHSSWSDDIERVAALAWGTGRALRGMGIGAACGAALGWVVFSAAKGIQATPEWRELLGAMFGPSMALAVLGIILGGLHETVTEDLDRPNLGIWVSLRSGIFGGLITAVGLFLGLILAFAVFRPILSILDIAPGFILEQRGKAPNPSMAMATAMLLGSFAFLWYGGVELIKHGTLRLLLWWHGTLPLRLNSFLAACADRGLLRHRAGGAIFRHRAVLEYFATRTHG